MKKIAWLLSIIGPGLWLAPNLRASNAPEGAVLELHSCSIYAGGCIVSSQATQGGRYMLRAWHIAGGEFDGQNLGGLSAGLLEIASANMADSIPAKGDAVLYLPKSASPAQRQALAHWLRAQNPELARFGCSSRVLDLNWRQKSAAVHFAAGNLISITTASVESCPAGACGQELWYQPQSATSMFTVAVNVGSEVREPRLQLTWNDHNRASIFLGDFGGPLCGKNVFVKTRDFCMAGR